jgi:hypothetical protein
MVFCAACSGFVSIIGGPYLTDHYRHQPSFDALQASSGDCQLCHLILDRFRDTDQITSIVQASQDGYPTVITFVGIDCNGPWKYYGEYQSKQTWTGLVGLIVNCGDEYRNDDWSCQLCLYTDHGKFGRFYICFTALALR